MSKYDTTKKNLYYKNAYNLNQVVLTQFTLFSYHSECLRLLNVLFRQNCIKFDSSISETKTEPPGFCDAVIATLTQHQANSVKSVNHSHFPAVVEEVLSYLA